MGTLIFVVLLSVQVPLLCFFFFFLHRHKMKWSRHYSTSRLSWLCLLVVHSVIEMGVRVLPGRKSACQLAFSALFPISIKHLHHLLWAHSATPRFPLEPCTSDRWRVLGSNHFSNPADARLTLSFPNVTFNFCSCDCFFWWSSCRNLGENIQGIWPIRHSFTGAIPFLKEAFS